MAIENFSTGWTETDPSGKLTQSSTRSTWTNMIMNADQYLSRTNALGLTGDFDIAFEYYVDSSSGGSTVPGVLELYTTDMVHATWVDSGKVGSAVNVYFGVNTTQVTSIGVLATNTLYYCRLKRVGTTTTLDYYTSSADRDANTNKVIATLSVTETVYTMNKAWAPTGYDNGESSGVTGYIQNLDFSYVPPAGSTVTGMMSTNTGMWGAI